MSLELYTREKLALTSLIQTVRKEPRLFSVPSIYVQLMVLKIESSRNNVTLVANATI